MPVDRRVFTAEFTLLLERFGREPHQLLIARYFEYLDARLTTEEFQAAARRLFEEARFWPAPVEFLHAAKGDPKQLAGEAWQALIKALKAGRPHDAPPEAIAILKRSGATFRDLEEASEHRLAQLERAFKAEHEATPAPAQQRRLPGETLTLEGSS